MKEKEQESNVVLLGIQHNIPSALSQNEVQQKKAAGAIEAPVAESDDNDESLYGGLISLY